MNKVEAAAKAYQEKEHEIWTGEVMAKVILAAFVAGAEWQSKQQPDFQRLWKQSIQLPGLYTFDEAREACPEGYRLPTREEQEWLVDNSQYHFDFETKEGVFRLSDGFELRLPGRWPPVWRW